MAQVYFWSIIRKLKANYHACRGVQEEDVCKILQNNVVINKDAATAQEKLLQLSGLKKYHKGLRTEDEKEHFVRHLRKYINMYLPDCPFEVSTSNRYTIQTAEACIIARRHIRKGESIKYLSGIQVELSEDEEKELNGGTDFSIVISSRRKRPSLFLGPARFANHDCQSNANLNTTGPHGIHIVARKEIQAGEEITVNYGEDYFGEDNSECLCNTCESLLRNGWDPKGPILPEESSDEESDEEENAKPAPVRTHRKPNPSPPKKRKRVNEEAEHTADDSDVTSKRPVGRPRKYARGEEPKRMTGTGGSSNESSEDEQDGQRPDYRGPFARTAFGKHAKAAPAHTTKEAAHAEFTPRRFWPQMTAQQRSDPLLEKVIRILGRVADREERTKSIDSSNSSSKTGAVTPATTTDEDVEMADAEDDLEHLSNGRTTVRGARGRFTSAKGNSFSLGHEWNDSTDSLDSVRAAPSENQPESAESLKSKLPSVKKERSFSSLRNVTNVNDTADVYSIQPSPAPQAEQPVKRKRGRPRKYPKAEELVDTTDPSSPSSMGTDNSSSVSQASSATSLDTFSAGNIAQEICDMLTTGRESEERKSTFKEEVTITKARTTTTRTISRTRTSKSQKSIDATLLSPEKGGRGRDALRKSPRGARSDRSEPPVLSIEKMEVDEDKEEIQRGDPRTPGDYHLCEALLITQYHRWVECRNCDEHFVQPEAYQTRIACPRCERHSKLYGYYWPKTDKEGKHDREERILDHRQIHRFIDPEEERFERKGKKALAEVLREKEEQELSEQRESMEMSDRKIERSFRVSKRRSESRRNKTKRTTM